MKTILIILILFTFSFSENKKITFINPGKSNELFWLNVSKFMIASAEDFKFDLDIYYAQRNHYKMLEILKQIIKEEKKPDFLIIVNENNMADRLISLANKHKIKTMLILNDLSKKQKEIYGKPRKNYKYWIGTIIPNNIHAGYLIAKSLIKEKKDKTLHLLAINGEESTFAARHRFLGLQKALKEYPNIKLVQKFIADWREDISYNITKRALARYKNIDLIWTANDPMAFGAIKAAKKMKRDILISGLNWSNHALDAIEKDELVATVGGHYMIGGWALVLINDYINGVDFKNEALEIKEDIFGTIDKSNYKEYKKYFSTQDYSQIDFKKFSKSQNPEIKKYDFSLEKILEQLK